MATRFLLPQSDVDVDGWQLWAGTGDAWQRVNDGSADPAEALTSPGNDGLTSYLRYLGDGPRDLLLGLNGTFVAGDTIASVTVRVWVKPESADNQGWHVIANSGATRVASEPFSATSGDFVAYTLVLATDPATGAAWTAAAVNALQIGADGYLTGSWGITAVEAEVSYTAAPADPPTGDWTYEAGAQVLTVDATGLTPDEGQTITAYSWDWGDGTAAGSGATARHVYATSGTKTVTLTVTYSGGAEFEIDDDIDVGEFSFTVSVNVARVASVDASANTLPTGETISGYSWDWGDSTDPDTTSGDTAQHAYAAGGTYTITLTASVSGGGTIVTTEEVHMSTITRVSPLKAIRGATGTAITITGTGFVATQTTGTLTIGGQAVIVDTWSDTSIVCHADDDPATPLGVGDVVITPSTGTAATLVDAIMIVDATDNKTVADVEFGMVSEIYLDGEQIGLTGEDGVDIAINSQSIGWTPDDGFVEALDKTYVSGAQVTIRPAQFFQSGAKLVKLLGGSYDITSKTVTVVGGAAHDEHSLLIVEDSGMQILFPRCKLLGDLTWSLNKQWKSLPATFKVLRPAIPTEPLYKMYLNV